MENSLYSCNPFEFGTGGRRITFPVSLKILSKNFLLKVSENVVSYVCVFSYQNYFLTYIRVFLITNSRMNSFFGFSRLDVAFTAVPSTSTSYGSGLVIGFNTIQASATILTGVITVSGPLLLVFTSSVRVLLSMLTT